jgi:hypothetical protein
MTVRKQQPLPYDPEAERAMVGAAIQWPDRLDGVADDLTGDDFYDLQHRAIWVAVADLIANGSPVDQVTVLDRVGASAAVGANDLIDLRANALPPLREHADIILRHSAARRARLILAEAEHELKEGVNPFVVAERAAGRLDEVGSMSASGRIEAMTLPDLIASAANAAPWVVHGLLRSDWRAIVVAGEGLGKSTLLRQLAVCAAQGIHPLTCRPMEPIRSLIIDAENPLAAIAETGKRLDEQARRTAGDAFEPERCKVWSRPGGLDLRTPRDRGDLVREIRDQRPQLVVAGPVYKLGRRHEGESYEDAAEGMLAVLDDLRTRFDFALVLEHHAPKPLAGKRDMLPFGSQRWMAWPELGITLKEKDTGPELELGRFRGDRLTAWWPDRLERGTVWPWQGVWDHGVPKIEDIP